MSDVLVVGVDGSPESEAALSWGLAEAGRRGLAVELVYALAVPVISDAYGMMLTRPDLDELIMHSEQVLAAALAAAQAAAPELSIGSRMASGPPAAVLVDTSRNAGMVVVGTRGTSALAGHSLGSVSIRLAGRSICPVVVVPPDWRATTAPDGPVLVGVDGSHYADEALRVALEQARLWGVGLRVITAYHLGWTSRSGDSKVLAEVEESERWLAECTLRETLVRVKGHAYHELDIEQLVVSAHPAEALVAASGDASLTVVGSRGWRSFGRAILGSVSRTLMQESNRPVMVVHQPRR